MCAQPDSLIPPLPQSIAIPARRGFPTYGCIGIFVVIGLLLRIPGLFTDFWLDEIWTYQLIHERIHSSPEIFTQGRIDNNHPFNTWLMYLMGDRRHWEFYRIPSLLAGLGMVVLAGRIGLRRANAVALAAAGVMAVSFVSIVYSTEARGYGLVMFFALAAVDSLDQIMVDHKLWRCAIFGIASLLGFLSHPTFIIVTLATLCWSAVELIMRRNWRKGVRDAVAIHAFPLIFAAIYFPLFVLRMSIGGHEKSDLHQVIHDSLAFVMGLSSGESTGMSAVRVAMPFWILTLVIVGIAWPRMLALFIPGVLVLPAILLITADSRDMTIFPRYISPALALMLLAFGLAMGQLWQWKAWIGKSITIVLLTLFAAGNIHQLFRFTRDGRGHYLQGLQFMREHGDGRIIVLSSDQELRHLKLLTFYARYLPDGSIIRPVPWESISARWPRWFVVSSLQAQDVPQEAYLGNLTFSNAPLDPQMAQKRYALRQIYPYYGPSGTLWAVYEVEN